MSIDWHFRIDSIAANVDLVTLMMCKDVIPSVSIFHAHQLDIQPDRAWENAWHW